MVTTLALLTSHRTIQGLEEQSVAVLMLALALDMTPGKWRGRQVHPPHSATGCNHPTQLWDTTRAAQLQDATTPLSYRMRPPHSAMGHNQGSSATGCDHPTQLWDTTGYGTQDATTPLSYGTQPGQLSYRMQPPHSAMGHNRLWDTGCNHPTQLRDTTRAAQLQDATTPLSYGTQPGQLSYRMRPATGHNQGSSATGCDHPTQLRDTTRAAQLQDATTPLSYGTQPGQLSYRMQQPHSDTGHNQGSSATGCNNLTQIRDTTRAARLKSKTNGHTTDLRS